MAINTENLIAKEYALFDKDHFRIVKGIGLLAVLTAFICRALLGFAWLPIVEGAAGAVFLFCSGFGVSESYIGKRGLPHYWENKFLKVWIPSLAVMTLFSLIDGLGPVYWVTQSLLGLKGNVLYLIFGAYAAFWLVFQLLSNRTARIVGLFLSAAVAFVFIEDKLSACLLLAFPVGVLFSQCGFKYKIRKMGWMGSLLLVILLAIPAAAAWAGAIILSQAPYIGNCLWNVAFVLTAVVLLLLVYYGRNLQIFGIFAPIGTISYAVYLCYRDIFRLFMKGTELKAVFIVLAFLALVASLLTWLRYLLITWNKNLRRRRRTHIKGRI